MSSNEEQLEGIEPIEEPEAPETTEATEPETTEQIQEIKSVKELAIEKLTEKVDAGYDLANKEEKARICHEIANEIKNIVGSCSYQSVSSQVPTVLKVKKQKKSDPEIKTHEGNTIIKKGIETIKRPDKKIIDETTTEQTQLSTEEQVKKFLELQNQTNDSFEAISIKFALEDVAFLISALGLPKPQTKLLEQRAKQIASYNNLQRSKGNYKNVIEVSDSILKYAIYLGLASTFLQPIIKKYFPKKDSSSKTGIETKSSSLRG